MLISTILQESFQKMIKDIKDPKKKVVIEEFKKRYDDKQKENFSKCIEKYMASLST